MQDRPTAVELLDTLATYLEEEVGPELEGPLVYRTRVALNCLSVVRRELSDEEALPREAARLAALLDTPVPEGSPRVALEALNAQLAERLRRGGDAAFDEAAWPVLMAGAREKLAVLRPGYDGYDSAGERPGGAS
jgi:hypothetical protein